MIHYSFISVKRVYKFRSHYSTCKVCESTLHKVGSIPQTESGWCVCVCGHMLLCKPLCCIVEIFVCLQTISIVFSALLLIFCLCVRIFAHANIVPMLICE